MAHTRRAFLAGGLAFVPTALAFARAGYGHDGGLYESLRQPGRIDRPARRAANPGRWTPKAPLLVPRGEMAWAAEHAGRMHLLGG